MNQQQQDIFAGYDNNMNQYAALPPTTNRSPPSSQGYGQHTLNRQTSRHFDINNNNFNQNSFHHVPSSTFQSTPRHDASRFEGMTTPSLQPSYGLAGQYESNSWNMPQMHHNLNGIGGQMGMGMGMGSATLGASNRMKPQSGSRRPAIPNQWMEQQQPAQAHTYDRTGPIQNYQGSSARSHTGTSQTVPDEPEVDEDLIPTAIVIKNIPFAVKKEQLVERMTSRGLPLPYAFNYHFDGGVFRGLAFANFSSPEETREVIHSMNNHDIGGRKLRVEYKKMLPVHERERIEREKRERRGQLEEQHRPVGMLHSQASLSSLAPSLPNAMPSPVQSRTSRGSETGGRDDLDMNDDLVQKYNTDLILFRGDSMREAIIFPPTLPAEHRTIIHKLAHKHGLEHKSRGVESQRQVVITKSRPDTTPQLPAPPFSSTYQDYTRRGLNRAATTDFTNVARGSNQNFHALEPKTSSYLDIPSSPSNGFGTRQNLRDVKSFADLRSHNGSPSLMNSSAIPPMPNSSRFTDVGLPRGQSPTPSITPTSGTLAEHEELIGPMIGMSLSSYPNERPSANRSSGRLNVDRENYNAPTSVIGSQRPSNGTYEDQSRNGTSIIPERQPRLPGWSEAPFSNRGRQNGHSNTNGTSKVWDDHQS